jgi:hypothetical protein
VSFVSFAAVPKSQILRTRQAIIRTGGARYMQTAPAPVVNVPLSEYQPWRPIEGDWR